jgi:hypothetical protein
MIILDCLVIVKVLLSHTDTDGAPGVCSVDEVGIPYYGSYFGKWRCNLNTTSVKLRSLREHPAQMRTEMDPEEMARLVLQVYERGLDEHQPIVAAQDSDGAYRVVSGHRRWLAALLAEEVKVRLDGKKDGANLDFVRQVVSEFAAHPAEVEVCVFCQELLEETQNGEG